MEATVRHLTERGIPVMGHIGLTPQNVNVMGGFKTQGRSRAEWPQIEETQKPSRAGVFAIVLEGMAAELADKISSEISVPTIGIGASPGCDGQILVTEYAWAVSVCAEICQGICHAGCTNCWGCGNLRARSESRKFPEQKHTYAMKTADRQRPNREQTVVIFC